MSTDLKSVCLMLRREQHDRLQEMNVNISGFVRDIIDDRLSDHVITLGVSQETRALYDRIISLSSHGDADFEPYLRNALKDMLKDYIEQMQDLHKSLNVGKGKKK
ncbi:MAG: hypothetical protein HYS17_02390 [Micavibrio aeruginosavorus]|uniref:Uncharacterized protein n=1 Tax=Micavibrio aeruginosavorus TaxID=349221 RepID=A0A7T5R317_9BACT|nr:MAG: hypothetical protein HYS17_02390 [Micavibrio aeruginosavorus]